MRLEAFRVMNFRSINDSGWVKVSQITALLGRNESGKSNLLRALDSLNPAQGFAALSPIKDFPRHRRLEECTDETVVVESRWSLNSDDLRNLASVLPRASSVMEVTIKRRYDKVRPVDFIGLAPLAYDEADVKLQLRKLVPAVKAAAESAEATKKAALDTAADVFEAATVPSESAEGWATAAKPAFQALRKALAVADAELSEKQEAALARLEDLANEISGDREAQEKARSWVLKNMAEFVYVDEYPELSGHQDINAYLSRKTNNQLTVPDRHFENLCKVAGLDPQKLQQLLGKGDQETRNQLANRAGSVVTSEIRRLWKDRSLKIRFNLDANHLDTLISDPSAAYEVEVNLNERSRGFQWFFSFYITFAADTKTGFAQTAILLLDEPGLYLHARSQTDLLRHFEKDFSNQILYTTHSPFMVPTHNLDSVRTVNINEAVGTTVTNDPTGDSRTLFPLQAALGYNIAQSLFIGTNNLVVEGVTDYWFLSTASAHLSDTGSHALSADLTITPAGGAQKVSYMVALLTSEEQAVLVLLDQEKESRATKSELVKNKLINEQNVVFVTEAFSQPAPTEADVEDILEPDIYEALVRESYSKELVGKTLALNLNVPRIARRFELAFEGLGIEFKKTRPARLWIQKMATEPSIVFPDTTAERFARLFETVNQRLQKHSVRAAGPFQ